MHRTLIKNATCVFPQETGVASVLIEDGRIAAIDPAASIIADDTVDAAGLHLIPGVIDDQVHFREPGLTHKEDLESGSRAAARGGVTTYLEMPNTQPPAVDRQRLHEKLDRAREVSRVNYGFFIGATGDNVEELAAAERTPGIKIFVGSSTGDLLVDEQEALERIFAKTTLPITAHCEDETLVQRNQRAILESGQPVTVADHSRIRTNEAAAVSTARMCDLARRHQHRFHVLHVSSREELPHLSDHRKLITAEVCPHHLFFNVDDYDRLGSRIQMNPSVKSAADNDALWQALQDRVIQVVATDHAPHTLEEKDQPYPKSPSGLPAIENSLALFLNQVHRGLCRLEDVVEWMCDAPARVWDLRGKGRIAEGYDADLVLVDLAREETIRDENQITRSRWSPWDGVTLTGWPVRTWVMGQTVFQDGNLDDAVRGHEARFDHARGGYWA